MNIFWALTWHCKRKIPHMEFCDGLQSQCRCARNAVEITSRLHVWGMHEAQIKFHVGTWFSCSKYVIIYTWIFQNLKEFWNMPGCEHWDRNSQPALNVRNKEIICNFSAQPGWQGGFQFLPLTWIPTNDWWSIAKLSKLFSLTIPLSWKTFIWLTNR